MKPNQEKNNERGIAMFLAMMTLLILAVIGVGFMFMADTENSVNNNYRDSQRAYFASRAGLENVRVLLASGPLNTQALNMDGVMPSGSGGVIYVFNPTASETVSPTSGDYVDDELCQELYSSLNTSLGYTTISNGMPCAAPNSSGYYATASGLAVNSSNPTLSDIPFTGTTKALPFKWVRITNKQNLMGLAAPNGASASATVDNTTNYSLQVCFDGTNEFTIPSGQKCTAQTPQADPVWLVTSMAVTPKIGSRPGSRRVTQMEMALSPPLLPPGVVSTQAPLLFHGSSVNVDAMDNCSCDPTSCSTNSKTGVTTCQPRAGYTSCAGAYHSAYTAGTVSTNGNPTATSSFGSDLTGTASIQNVNPWPYNIDSLINSYKAGASSPAWASSCTGTSNFAGIPPTYMACGTQSSAGPFGTYPTMDSNGNVTSPGTPQTTYIPGSVQLTANATGSGVLIVDGDLDLHGGLNFYGLVLVRGMVTFSGGGSSGVNIYGAVLAGGDITNVVKGTDIYSTDSFGGNVNLQYDVCALTKASSYPSPRLLATHEIQY